MRKRAAVAAAVILLAATSPAYQIDQSRYFRSAPAELESRAALLDGAQAFVRSATPQSAVALRRWLGEYDALLTGLERHDIYVYLRAEENDRDAADAAADVALGELEDRLDARVAAAAGQLGAARIESLTSSPALTPYRYLLESALARDVHRLGPQEQRAVDVAVTPVLATLGDEYKRLRKSSDPIAGQQDAYAALLLSIAAARNGVARLRGFAGAAQAAYFDRSIGSDSVERALRAVRSSGAYARYRAVAALAPKPAFSPAPVSAGAAVALVLAAERPMGPEYADAYAALLSAQSGRLELCFAAECDDTGFSLGFTGVDSAVYYGSFSGSVDAVRALAHESGHAVHREFMSRAQPIAAYNRGPSFMFESFAIFNELLLLDHLYETAPDDRQRGYYLDDFLDDATFQVFGSAEETELESAIYRGAADGTIRTAADLNALALKVFAQYDPSASTDPATALYWARDRLFFTDALYDVNYLYAGLLALRYFSDYERDPATFSKRYVALLKNGFTDTPAALEARFLGIDLRDEAGLVTSASTLIDARSAILSTLYRKARAAK
jgi:oligoendopeptidase F